MKVMTDYFISKGYEFKFDFEGLRTFGSSNGELFAHDLDCRGMKNYEDIMKGAIHNEGEFKKLNKLYEKLKGLRVL